MNNQTAVRSGRCAVLVFVLAVLVLASGCAVAPAAAGPRPAQWASPVAENAGLPNLHRVNAALYRSAQPTKEGFVFLGTQAARVAANVNADAAADQPIKTIVSLQAFHDETALVAPFPALRLAHIPFNTWHPKDKDVIRFLRIATTPALQPVLVHCRHGADRTGTMVAIYRIAYEGWSKAEAMAEMTGGGFGFHPVWKNLLRYIGNLDVDAIKAEVAKQGVWQ